MYYAILLLSAIIPTTTSLYAFKSIIKVPIISPCISGHCLPTEAGSKHEDIDKDILGDFIKPSVLNDISDEHGFVDVVFQLSSRYHFDNCDFQSSTENINSKYSRLLTDLNPDPKIQNLDDAPDAFGQILHIAQDFYAHSNWVDLGKTNARTDLIDNGNGMWAVLTI